MIAGIWGDVMRIVIVLPPLHPGPQEQRDKDAHDGVGTARGEELIVPHIMSDQSQLHVTRTAVRG